MSKFETLLDIYKSHQSYLGKESLPPRTTDFDQLASTFFCPGPHYYYVIDSPTLTIDYVSPNVEELLGIRPDEFSFEKFMEVLHPDDIDYFLRCEDMVADFLTNRISPQQVTRYKITYCLREKTKEQGYRLFLLQTITLQTSKEGSLLKVFGLQTDITHITAQNNHMISFVGLMAEPSYLQLDVFSSDPYTFQNSAFTFTKREIQIIKLLGEGLTTDEISEQLFISRETVNTHRKNTLIKSGFKNTTQVLAHCIRTGLI